jgi:hypothetical protein
MRARKTTQMKVMITLTVGEGKRLIAKAIMRMPEVVQARQSGRIFLKGGTTVSAIAEELTGEPMRISGRITPNGLKGAKVLCDAPHYILVEHTGWRGLQAEELLDVVLSLGSGDVFIAGANIIDAYGGAALMASTPLGGNGGRILSPIMAEGITTIVTAGLEKLIPGTVEQAVRAAGRKGVELSMGAPVGLMPFFGKVVTEIDAVKLLAPVECQVVGRGGIGGAEGSVTVAVSGEAGDVRSVFRLAAELKGAAISGVAESLEECECPNSRCETHTGCIYRSPGLVV